MNKILLLTCFVIVLGWTVNGSCDMYEPPWAEAKVKLIYNEEYDYADTRNVHAQVEYNVDHGGIHWVYSEGEAWASGGESPTCVAGLEVNWAGSTFAGRYEASTTQEYMGYIGYASGVDPLTLPPQENVPVLVEESLSVSATDIDAHASAHARITITRGSGEVFTHTRWFVTEEGVVLEDYEHEGGLRTFSTPVDIQFKFRLSASALVKPRVTTGTEQGGQCLALADPVLVIDPAYEYAEYLRFVCVSVPEPSSLLLLGVGAFGLLAYAWCRRRS